MKTNIFNIQKFSLHDGKGIRTVVFFKGCPLKCLWCSNPESQNRGFDLSYDKKFCKSCMSCVSACEKKAIDYKDEKIVIDKNKCILCGKCVSSCLYSALKMEGYEKTVDDIVKEVLKDRAFYETSNGGATFSGGEVLLNTDFAVELASELHKNNIHVAIETSGYSDESVFKKLINSVDYVMFDIKHYDNNKHIEGTGVELIPILKNLQTLTKSEKDFLIRVPVIPLYNDSIEDAKNYAMLLSKYNIDKIELLPFHQFGQRKYELLNMKYKMNDAKEIKDLTNYIYTFNQNGIKVI